MMHKSLLLVVFTAFSTLLFSQSKPDKIAQLGNRRTELYYFSATSYDSIRFTIRGEKDTVLTETFFRNGRVNRKKWQQDSSYTYSELGYIDTKVFGIDEKSRPDSSITYRENNIVSQLLVYKKNAYSYAIEWDYYGNILKKDESYSITPTKTYRLISDSLGKMYSRMVDTMRTGDTEIIWHNDTFYHRNGRIFYVSHYNSEDEYLIQNYYDDKGNLIEAITPTAKRLIAFKDNVDCYYGFKNSNGDTIIPPRFDRYQPLGHNFYAVYEGDKCRLMQLDGTFIETPDMKEVFHLSEQGAYSTFVPENTYWRFKLSQLNRSIPINIDLTDSYSYFAFQKEGKFGVIDRKGKLVMPPQYRRLKYYEDNGQLFSFEIPSTVVKEQIVELGYLNRQGESLFPQYKYASRINNDYFMVAKTIEYDDIENINLLIGLVNIKGELILDCQYFNMGFDYSWSNLLRVNFDNLVETNNFGFFDVKNRRWLVDTTKYSINQHYGDNFSIISFKKTNKFGIIDEFGTIGLEPIYDSLSFISDNLFIAKKGKNYSFLDVSIKEKRPVYDYLKKVFNEIKIEGLHDVGTPIFVAKRGGKWGIVDSNDRILRPFTADYAGLSFDNSLMSNFLFLSENNKVLTFDKASFPNEADMLELFADVEKSIINAGLVDEMDKKFFFNKDGRVLVPPQYKIVPQPYEVFRFNEFNHSFYLIQNDKRERKIVLFDLEKIIDFPFTYAVKFASSRSDIIVVADNSLKQSNRYGIVSTKGKQLLACNNDAIALTSEQGEDNIFFAQKGVSEDWKKRVYMTTDSLTEIDKNWYLYNSEGVLLNKTPFNYPFKFDYGLGIGMQGNDFNLFRTDGTIFTSEKIPPQYRNIRRDDRTGFYYLFQNQGLTTTVSIKKEDGTPILDSGRYDGAGIFYDKYTLVSLGGKVGLIDSFGREIIAPQDLYTYNQSNLVDSLDIKNKILRKAIEGLDDADSWEKRRQLMAQTRELPIDFVSNFDKKGSIDSLNLPANLRNAAWHLLLATRLDDALFRVGDVLYKRSNSIVSDFDYQGHSMNGKNLFYQLYAIKCAKKTLSFVFKSNRVNKSFHNYYFKNSHWNDLQINDLLQIQGEKRWQFNELLTRKIKAMKDEEIDCSNASAFIAQVENRFMLTKDGVDFCFDSKKESGGFAIVSFTWAELEGFLKMRI